jgi:hypothetical protein
MPRANSDHSSILLACVCSSFKDYLWSNNKPCAASIYSKQGRSLSTCACRFAFHLDTIELFWELSINKPHR